MSARQMARILKKAILIISTNKEIRLIFLFFLGNEHLIIILEEYKFILAFIVLREEIKIYLRCRLEIKIIISIVLIIEVR